MARSSKWITGAWLYKSLRVAKWVADSVLDAALEFIAFNGTNALALDDDRVTNPAANLLGIVGINLLKNEPLPNTGMSISDGDVSGRKLTINPTIDLGVVTSSGTCTHVAVYQVSPTALLLQTTTPAKAITGGEDIAISQFDFEISDPV